MTEPCRSDCPARDCAGCAFPPTSCMGGWCSVRQQCARYLQPSLIAEERLCPSWNHIEFIDARDALLEAA